jgi:hypothetical protein
MWTKAREGRVPYLLWWRSGERKMKVAGRYYGRGGVLAGK